MHDNTGKPLTMLWLTSGSCANIKLIYDQGVIPAATIMSYAPSMAEEPSWMPGGATPSAVCQCAVPAGGKIPDIANSALFNSACTNTGPKPATIQLTQGPVQAYVLATPQASSQAAITMEEAYFVFGFGMAGMISPWGDELSIFIRTMGKSTLLAWAANIGVPEGKWKGMRFDGSAMVVSSLEGAAANAEKAIGILGAEVYDARRDTLNALAFQAKGQYAAFYPDSSATARDKKNVRDGHYTVWSPTVWMDKITGTTPANPNTRYIIDLIAGKTVTPAASFDMIGMIAAVGLVPDCAMGVTRELEGGPLSIYRPAESCTCKYESLVDQTACATCTTTCASGTCRNGFCEVR